MSDWILRRRSGRSEGGETNELWNKFHCLQLEHLNTSQLWRDFKVLAWGQCRETLMESTKGHYRCSRSFWIHFLGPNTQNVNLLRKVLTAFFSFCVLLNKHSAWWKLIRCSSYFMLPHNTATQEAAPVQAQVTLFFRLFTQTAGSQWDKAELTAHLRLLRRCSHNQLMQF